MTNRSRVVAGVGINDADYEVSFNTPDGKVICPFYQTWADMLRRCYSAKTKSRSPSYQGCTVAPIWFSFSEFRKWMIQQDYKGKDLEKDILFPGNKIYSPDTCVFVSRNINIFVTDSGSRQGEWPVGVHWNKEGKTFVAQCRNPFTGKAQHLGCFADPELAHAAWRAHKHKIALIYADLQTDPRVAAALRARYAPSRRESGHHSDDSEYEVIEPNRLPHGPDECAKAQLDILSQE